MLIISREKDQSIYLMIDGSTVGRILVAKAGQKIKLGFELPKNIKVVRDDLKLKDRAFNK